MIRDPPQSRASTKPGHLIISCHSAELDWLEEGMYVPTNRASVDYWRQAIVRLRRARSAYVAMRARTPLSHAPPLLRATMSGPLMKRLPLGSLPHVILVCTKYCTNNSVILLLFVLRSRYIYTNVSMMFAVLYHVYLEIWYFPVLVNTLVGQSTTTAVLTSSTGKPVPLAL